MKKPQLVWLAPAALLVLSACGISTMPSHDEWYTKHYYIMQDFERQAYKKYSPAGRLEFQQVFWEARDPKSKKIYDERMVYVMMTYKRDNARQPWNCDRGRIYLLNGPPNDVESRQNNDWTISTGLGGGGVANLGDRTNEDISANTLEVWIYRYDKYLVQYIFYFKPPNEWRLAPTSFDGNRYLGALEIWSKENTFPIQRPDEYNLKLEELKSIR
jgi:GWxTD domain-containing protein